jgi:Peptidase family M28
MEFNSNVPGAGMKLSVRVMSVLGVSVLAGCVLAGMPGKSYKGSVTQFSADENAVAERLKSSVVMLAEVIGERNTIKYSQLQMSARYIKGVFQGLGYVVKEESYLADGKRVMNIIAEKRGTTHPSEIVLAGAHYDSPPGSPGANDNASGVAAMLELARQFRDVRTERTLRFVAFVNEEPPWFQTELMGSRVHAAGARKRGENITYMLTTETIGCYSDVRGSQKYPFPVNLFYPDKGDYIAFVGNIASRKVLSNTVDSFRKTTPFPSEGIAAPEFITGIGWSDHWSFWQEGYPGLMVTDTAPFRYSHYHKVSDTPEKLDYQRMARVVTGLGKVIEQQVN